MTPQPPLLPAREAERLACLQALGALESAPDPALDQIAWLATQLSGAPQAYVGLMDRDHYWIQGRAVDDQGGPRAWPRHQTPCAQAIAQPDALWMLPDVASDPAWAAQPPMPGPRPVRFYAGAVLLSAEGHALGTLALVDAAPRSLTPPQQQALRLLAAQAVTVLELGRLRRQSQPQALHDEATGAWSHDAFHRRLAEEWSRHARRGESMALMMLALDGGVPGAAVPGTEGLPQVLRVVGEALRASDHLSRHPGQRFAVLLPGSGLGSAMSAAQRVRQAVERLQGGEAGIGLGIGVAAMAPTPRGDPLQLLARAEHALQTALNAGHNRIQPFSGW